MGGKFFSFMSLKGAGRAVFPASLVAFILTGICLDRLIFPLLEDHKIFWGAAWSDDEKKLFKLNCLRNWASSQDPLFRNHLIQPLAEKERRGPRILVMGDSFVWGDGYRNINDLWWRQLSRQLSDRGFSNVEVLAAGYPGFSTALETKAARRLIRSLKPDLIVFGYTENDADEGLVKQNAAASISRASGLFKRILPNLCIYIDRQIFSRWKSFSSLETANEDRKDQQWEFQLLDGENFKRFKGTVADMGQLLKESGTPGFVVSLPKSPDAQYYEACFEPVKPLFSEAAVPFLDLSRPLKGWYGEALPTVLALNPLALVNPGSFLHISPANSHPSAALTHFYGRQAADFIEKNYRHILGTKVEPVPEPTLSINDCMPIFAGVTRTRSGVEFSFPDPSLLLKMPGRKPFVQFNLENPLPLKKILVKPAGKVPTACTFYVTTINAAVGFDTGKTMIFEGRPGAAGQFEVDLSAVKEAVNTVGISANYAGAPGAKAAERMLQLELAR